MPVNNNNGNKIAKIKTDVEELIARKMVFNKPGPPNGDSTIASICARY